MSKANRLKNERDQPRAVAEHAPGAALRGPAWQEFSVRLNELAVAHSFSVRGLPPQGDDLVQFIAREKGDLDKAMSIIPSGPWGDRMPSYGEKRMRDIQGFLAPRGPVAIQIGYQWAVTVFTDWESHYRARIAADLGLTKKDDLKDSRFGDLGHLRNDIVHHRGVATEKESGKLEIFRDWVADDGVIFIGEHQIVAFMDHLGLVKWEPRVTSDGIKEMIGAFEAESARRGGDRNFTLRRAEQPDS